MGGYGSGRWNWHSKKTQVEECTKLTIYFLKPYLTLKNWNSVRWTRGDVEMGSISYRVLGENYPTALRLIYTIGTKSGHPEDIEYPVNLTTTPIPWGRIRYWFICPLQGCGRRVGCLYLPPGGKYFGCRHCYNLTYESRQEGNSFRELFKGLADGMQDINPGIDWKDVRAILDGRETPPPKKSDFGTLSTEMAGLQPV